MPLAETWYRWQGEILAVQVWAQPNARQTEISGIYNGCLRIRVTAPPADGKANREIIRLLAKEFQVSQSRVVLVRGASQRKKTLHINGISGHPAILDKFA